MTFIRVAMAAHFCAIALYGVDGVVMNGTTGKPVSGVAIALVQPGASGLTALGNQTTDAEGKFSFPAPPPGPALLQAQFQGITYTKALTPGAPTSGLQVPVFDTTSKPVSKVEQHMILLQPTGTEVTVNETFLIQGSDKYTYSDHDNGTLKVFAPVATKDEVHATVGGAMGISLQQPVRATKQPFIWAVDVPIKPGETRIDFAYAIPTATPAVVLGRILHKEGKARLVVPSGVTLKGDNIAEVGKEPQTQATIYDVTGESYKVEVSGTGSLQAPEPAAGEDNGSPQIEQAQPPIYKHIQWITGLAFAILGLGTFLLIRNRPPAKQ